MGKDGISFQPKMSTNKQIMFRTQVLSKSLRYYALTEKIMEDLNKFEGPT